MIRSSGILLHITSLPSPYGIGNMGQAARDFVDFLVKARQRYWQILPISPTGYGDSPYQSASAFAGNPYLIDPDALKAQGLLTAEDLEGPWGWAQDQTDYHFMYEKRLPLLRKAFGRYMDAPDRAFADFRQAEQLWLEDYALFMALKEHFGGRPWLEWDAPFRLRKPAALKRWQKAHEDEILFHQWLQFEFFRQWQQLLDYAHDRGVSIIGDIPIYVPMDSADVWSAQNDGLFQLNRLHRPTKVAGVPPDGFTKDGQLWGNPLYNWENMAKDGFSWWLRRIGAAVRVFDVVRIDHFRGLESYWAVPAGNKTARGGKWVKGPGMALIDAIQKAYPQADFIAEDLGYLTPEVYKLVEDSGFPSMKVLQFAFDSREPSNYLPHFYSENCVCYTGTHDNTTLRQWYEEAPTDALDRDYARDYMEVTEAEDFCESVIRLGMSSKANLFMAQMQDYLDLGAEARMNQPGSLKPQNWRWRMLPGAANDQLAAKIAAWTEEFDRI